MGTNYVRFSNQFNESLFLLLRVGQEAPSILGFCRSLLRWPWAVHMALGPLLMLGHTWDRNTCEAVHGLFCCSFSLTGIWPPPNLSGSTRNQKVSPLSLLSSMPMPKESFSHLRCRDEILPPNFCPKYCGYTPNLLLTLEYKTQRGWLSTAVFCVAKKLSLRQPAG